MNGPTVSATQPRVNVSWQEPLGRLRCLCRTRRTPTIQVFEWSRSIKSKLPTLNRCARLIAGGADLLLVETIFDSLNAKAALVAIREVFDQDSKELPVMISAAVGRGGETLISAQTTEAFWNAVQHVKPALGGAQLFSGSRLNVSISGRTFRESERRHFLLPECGLAQSAIGNGIRSWAERHGSLFGRFCAWGPD